MLLLYDLWDRMFSNLNLPYDLQLWLYDPAFIRSEIICYKMEEDQQKTFVWQSEKVKAFPFDKLSIKLHDLTAFDWTPADDAEVIFENDLEDYGYTENQLLTKGFIKKIQNKTQVFFSKKIGDIWIGRRKSTKSEKTEQIIQGYFPPPS